MIESRIHSTEPVSRMLSNQPKHVYSAADSWMRSIDDEEEKDDRYHCVLIDLNHESPHEHKASANIFQIIKC